MYNKVVVGDKQNESENCELSDWSCQNVISRFRKLQQNFMVLYRSKGHAKTVNINIFPINLCIKISDVYAQEN